MLGKNDLLNTMYERDSKTKAYIIKTRIDEYSSLFNDLDPSPLRKRDIDQDFFSYLDEASSDIPLRSHIVLHIQLPLKVKDSNQEDRVKAGLSTYYNFQLLTMNRQISGSYKNFASYLVIAFCSLFIAFYLGAIISDSFIEKTLVEGFYIGGWVFFWEALVVLAFKTRDLRDSSKRLKRIVKSGIHFFYE
jgi:hypothetical protein